MRLERNHAEQVIGADGAARIGMEKLTGGSLDALTEQIIGCAIGVHKALGPGLLESI
jgi:PD-(D/E)XK nuclease superfamily protein